MPLRMLAKDMASWTGAAALVVIPMGFAFQKAATPYAPPTVNRTTVAVKPKPPQTQSSTKPAPLYAPSATMPELNARRPTTSSTSPTRLNPPATAARPAVALRPVVSMSQVPGVPQGGFITGSRFVVTGGAKIEAPNTPQDPRRYVLYTYATPTGTAGSILYDRASGRFDQYDVVTSVDRLGPYGLSPDPGGVGINRVNPPYGASTYGQGFGSQSGFVTTPSVGPQFNVTPGTFGNPGIPPVSVDRLGPYGLGQGTSFTPPLNTTPSIPTSPGGSVGPQFIP